jgi:hypothetical protein
MSDTYTQCRFARELNGALHTRTAWIDTKHARFGRIVSFFDRTERWQVTEVYATKDKDWVEQRHQVLKHHREHTDV